MLIFSGRRNDQREGMQRRKSRVLKGANLSSRSGNGDVHPIPHLH